MTLPSPKPIPGPEIKSGEQDGNLADIQAAGDLSTFLKNMHIQYGKVFKFYLDASTIAVSINDAKMAKRILHNKEKPNKTYEFLRILTGEAFTAPLEKFKPVRRLLNSKLDSNSIAKNFDSLKELINKKVDNWGEHTHKEENIDVQLEMKALSMQISILLFLGITTKEPGKLAESFQLVREKALLSQYQAGKKKASSQDHELKEPLDYINKTIEELLSKAQNTPFFDELKSDNLSAFKPNDVFKLFLMASYDTISSATAWTLYAIALHSKLSERAYNSGKQIGKLTYKRIKEAEKPGGALYPLRLILNESMRYYSPAPYTSRVSSRSLYVPEYMQKDQYQYESIPSGSTLFISIASMNHDPKAWDKPELFSPQRHTKKTFPKLNYIPYGGGQRICPSQTFANEMLMLILSCVFLRADLKVPNTFRPVIKESFVTTSANGLLIQVNKRARPITDDIKRLSKLAALPLTVLLLGCSFFYVDSGALAGKTANFFLTIVLTLLIQDKFNTYSPSFADNRNSADHATLFQANPPEEEVEQKEEQKSVPWAHL